jgi:hypothetical protein
MPTPTRRPRTSAKREKPQAKPQRTPRLFGRLPDAEFRGDNSFIWSTVPGCRVVLFRSAFGGWSWYVELAGFRMHAPQRSPSPREALREIRAELRRAVSAFDKFSGGKR